MLRIFEDTSPAFTLTAEGDITGFHDWEHAKPRVDALTDGSLTLHARTEFFKGGQIAEIAAESLTIYGDGGAGAEIFLQDRARDLSFAGTDDFAAFGNGASNTLTGNAGDNALSGDRIALNEMASLVHRYYMAGLDRAPDQHGYSFAVNGL